MIGTCKHGSFSLLEGCPQCAIELWHTTGAAPATIGTSTILPFTNVAVPIVMPTAVVKIKPEADAEVMMFCHQARELQQYAEARVIRIAEDLKLASDDLIISRRLKKALEEKRKEYVLPLQEHVKEINDTFKMLSEPIEQADAITTSKMLAFDLKQKLIREEQEEINRLRMVAAQKDAALHNGEISEPVSLIEEKKREFIKLVKGGENKCHGIMS